MTDQEALDRFMKKHGWVWVTGDVVVEASYPSLEAEVKDGA